MNKFIYLILIVIGLGACKNSKKLLLSGQYDQAINKSIKKIQKKRNNPKEILNLEEAYKKANERDNERIRFLKMEGTPDNWDNIFNLYTTMSRRQDRIKPLLPLPIFMKNMDGKSRNANINLVNYDQEIIQAKQKAAEYFYTHAISLIENGGKENIRKAYYELQQVKSYYANFKDTDEQLKRARILGTNYVVFKMQNKTGFPLPASFEEDLTKISLSELNGQWLMYETNENTDFDYDYTILVNMKVIDVSPESVKEIHYEESQEVEDGWKYELDDKGNVKKDSLGNDIKVKKYKTSTCKIIENYQNKKAIISGSLDYINNKSGQLIKTDPITAETFFEHRAAIAHGDISVLKKETKLKIGNKPMPFPSNSEMVLQAGQTLKGMVKNIIWQNKSLIL